MHTIQEAQETYQELTRHRKLARFRKQRITGSRGLTLGELEVTLWELSVKWAGSSRDAAILRHHPFLMGLLVK